MAASDQMGAQHALASEKRRSTYKVFALLQHERENEARLEEVLTSACAGRCRFEHYTHAT